MAYDYIEHTKRIENNLRILGHVDHAQDIEDARLGGSTSGEILMGIRFKVEKVTSQIADLPVDLRKDINLLVDAINQSGV